MILKRCGFSLIEVVIALALFSTSVVVILALLGSVAGRSKEVEESATALNLPAAVESALRTNGSNTVAGIRSFIDDDSHLIANYQGHQLNVGSGEDDESVDAYYRIDFAELNSTEFNNISELMLPLLVTVSWPYKALGSTSPTKLEDRSSVTFTLAISQ